MFVARLVAAGLVIDWFGIKVAAEVDMRFDVETTVEGVILEAVVVDGVDIHMGMALAERGTKVAWCVAGVESEI